MQEPLSIPAKIDRLTQPKCEAILLNIVENINTILKVKANSKDIREDVRVMSLSGKHGAIKVHSFNANGTFIFLAKIAKFICETLGVKTAVEKILEDTVNETRKIALK